MSDILAFGTGMNIELGQHDAGWVGMTLDISPTDWSVDPEPGGMQIELGFFSVGGNTGVPAERVGWQQPQRPARVSWMRATGKPVDWE